jgi:hypothetical protein
MIVVEKPDHKQLEVIVLSGVRAVPGRSCGEIEFEEVRVSLVRLADSQEEVNWMRPRDLDRFRRVKRTNCELGEIPNVRK